MRSVRRQQRGVILVLAAFFIVVILAIAALAMDVGRQVGLRSEMQNAADAAALAAAAELDGATGAQTRARQAARDLLQHDSRYATIANLLGSAGIPDTAFTFYCIIGSRYDPPFDITYCDDTPDPANAGRYLASTDARTHYVRVALDPVLAQGHFSLNLMLLPVLSVFGMQPSATGSAAATALGGHDEYACDVAPMAICDPFEGTGTTFAAAMVPGESIQLKQQGSNQWSSGNFGFLEPFYGGSGAGSVTDFLADEYATGAKPSCAPPQVTTQTGSIAQKAKAAINTRFDEYGPPNPFNTSTAPTQWPPARNVTEYTLDTNLNPLTPDGRFGGGQWNFDGYWSTNHPGVPAPNGWSNASVPTRYAVYNWEISNNQVPVKPTHTPRASPDRRLIRVAVLSCNAAGLTGGKKSAFIFPPDGLARMFLIRKAGQPSGPNQVDLYGEYEGWEDLKGGSLNAQLKLFE